MKKLIISVALTFCMCCAMSAAESGASTVYAGYAPRGVFSPTLDKTYCDVFCITADVEWNCDEFFILHDLQLVDGFVQTEGALRETLSISYMMMMGYVINRGKRLQFPLYAGLGANLWGVAGVDEFSGLIYGAKARARFFLTHRFGVYTGFSYQANFTSSKWKQPFLEIGLCIGLKNK